MSSLDHLDNTVIMPGSVYAAIVAHAREGKPEEICGVVRGQGLYAFEAIRGRNIASERIENYTIDPQTLLLQFEFEDGGDEMMGIYHSHPVSVAYPSATDAWNAFYPDAIYLICSLEYDHAPVLRAFRLTPYMMDIDWNELRLNLPFYETRPHLFGYYQSSQAELPSVLHVLSAEVSAPFYCVFQTTADDVVEDGRVVGLIELPIVVIE